MGGDAETRKATWAALEAISEETLEKLPPEFRALHKELLEIRRGRKVGEGS